MDKVFKKKVFYDYEDVINFVNYNTKELQVVSVTENDEEIILWYNEITTNDDWKHLDILNRTSN